MQLTSKACLKLYLEIIFMMSISRLLNIRVIFQEHYLQDFFFFSFLHDFDIL